MTTDDEPVRKAVEALLAEYGSPDEAHWIDQVPYLVRTRVEWPVPELPRTDTDLRMQAEVRGDQLYGGAP